MATTTLRLAPEQGDRSLTQQWLEEARQTGRSDEYTRKHRDPRFEWQVPLEVHFLNTDGRSETLYAYSRDVSEGGMAFECRQQIPAFTQVVVCRSGELVGVPVMTVSCTQGVTGYVMGCEYRFQEPRAADVQLSKAG